MKALVIGGTRGFGAHVCKQLEKRGYEIIAVGRSNGNNDKREYFNCDVGNIRSWVKTLAKIKKANSEIDLIVCIAGFARAKQFKKLKKDDWIEHFVKNILYVAFTFQKLTCKKAITVGSQWSYNVGCDELVPYSISKHALATLTQDLAVRNKNMIINHYCIPTMHTPQYQEVKNSFRHLGQNKNIGGFQKGIPANPKVIADNLVDFAINTKNSGRIYVLNKSGKILDYSQRFIHQT